MSKVWNLICGVWRYNFTSKYKTVLPVEIIVNLTYRCNSKCIMCNIWQSDNKKEMGYKDWKKVINDPIFSRVKSITVSGGEPILHPDFEEITDLFVNSLPKLKSFSLITNGFLTEQIIKQVERLSIKCQKKRIGFGVSVSLDGIGKIHQEVRQVEGAFDKTKTTLLKLKKMQSDYKFNLGAGSVILRQNLREFRKTKKWFKKNKINYGFQIVGFHETFVNNLNSEKNVNFLKVQKKCLMKVLRELRNEGGLRAYYWQDLIQMYNKGKPRSTPCPFLVDQCAIDGLGNVYYCLSEKRIGNFLAEKRTIAEIYSDDNNIQFRKSMKKKFCLSCNSGCNVNSALKYDLKKYLQFKISKKLSYD